MPEISVIIPVYKVEKTIERCVDSVLAQSFTDYEIILVDDGSPDDCPRICDTYSQKHENITVIHKENGGLSDARNAGLRIARGEYVMFLDSDDYLAENCFEPLLKGKGCDMIIGSLIITGYDYQPKKQTEREDARLSPADYADVLPDLLSENRINYVHGKLYRMQVIKEHHLEFEDDMLTSAEDTVFNFSFLPYCQSIFISGSYVHYYTFNPEGLARKAYVDRFQRFTRLYHITKAKCEQMGIDNDKMLRILQQRFVSSTNAAVRMIWKMKELSRNEKIRYLDEIYYDEELRSVIAPMDISPYPFLEYLMQKGSRKFVRNKSLMKQFSFLPKLYQSLPESLKNRIR